MELICYGAGNGENPENTIFAISKCVELNSEFRVHIDLQFTKDKEVILFRNSNTKKQTGENLEILDSTYKKLSTLNAAFNFEMDNKFPFRKQKLQIPTLKQVFKNFPKTKFLLDIQSNDIEIVEEIIAIINQFDNQHNIVVTSKNDNIINRLNDKTNIEIAATTIATRKILYENMFYLDSIIPIDANLLIIPKSDKGSLFLRKNIINYCKQRNKKTWTWIFEGNSTSSEVLKNQLFEFKENEVDGIFTSFPTKIQKEIELEQQLSVSFSKIA